MTENVDPAPRLTLIQWLICAMAAIGFAFDIYSILVMPLILQPVVERLTGEKFADPNSSYRFWTIMVLFVPFIPGGIFGLLGGYLTDLWGRQRVLVISILLYALSAVASGFATDIYMLIFFRCTTMIGV